MEKSRGRINGLHSPTPTMKPRDKPQQLEDPVSSSRV